MRLCLLLTAHVRKFAFTISSLNVNRLTEKVNIYSFTVFLLRQLVNFAKILRRQVTGRLRMSSKNSMTCPFFSFGVSKFVQFATFTKTARSIV